MDLSKLSKGDQVIGISGIALLIFSFFSWLGVKAGSGSFSAEGTKSAWGFTLTLIAVLIGIAIVAVVALKAAGVDIPKPGSFTWGQVLLVAAAVVFLFVLIKLITGVSGVPDVPGVSKTRKIGIFLGLIASAGLVAGAYLNFQGEKSGGAPSA
jgi:amino acid transporter